MSRGGRRAGRPGKQTYSNRSDLALAPRTAPAVVPTGQAYGTATANAETQQVASAVAAQQPRPQIAPVDFWNEQTDDVNEPVTAGLPMGPGPGPEALGLERGRQASDILRAAYLQFPDEDIRDLIEELDDRS